MIEHFSQAKTPDSNRGGEGILSMDLDISSLKKMLVQRKSRIAQQNSGMRESLDDSSNIHTCDILVRNEEMPVNMEIQSPESSQRSPEEGLLAKYTQSQVDSNKSPDYS